MLPVEPYEAAPPLRRAVFLGLLIGAAAIYCTAITGVPFYTKGEPREAIVVQQMLAEGEYITPLRTRGEIASKPPLFHWLGALASAVMGGVSEISVRVPSVLASLAAIAATMLAGSRLFGSTAALCAGAILVTCQQWLQSSSSARVDMVLAAAITVAMLAFLEAYQSRKPVPLLFYAASAAAVLAKGPVGYVLPLSIVALFLMLRRDREYLGRLRPATAAAILALPLLWYGLAWLEGGQAFVDKQILKENVFRVLDPGSAGTGHIRPFYYYVPALLGGMAPWSLLLAPVAVALWRRRASLGPDGSLFLLAWFTVTFVFYSAAGTKRPVYLLSSYPALALLIGAWLSGRMREGAATAASGRAAGWMLYVLAGSFIAVTTAVALQALGVPTFAPLGPLMDPKDAANLATVAASVESRRIAVMIWAVPALALLAVLVVGSKRRDWGLAFTTAALFLATTAAMAAATFLRDMAAGATLKGFMTTVAATVPRDEPLSFYRDMKYLEYVKPAAVYYAGRPIPVAGDPPAPGAAQRMWFLVGDSSLAGLTADVRSVPDTLANAPVYDLRVVERHAYDETPGREPILLVEATRRAGNVQPR